jgi:hypothetical protein
MSDNATQIRRLPVSGFSLLFVVAILAVGQISCVTKSKPTIPKSAAEADSSALSPEMAMLFNGGPSVPRAEPGQGLLWFPFVWQPQLIVPEKDSGLLPLDGLVLRAPRLVLRNNQTKAEVQVELRDEALKASKSYELLSKDPQSAPRFYLPRLLALSAGEYTVESIRLEIGSSGQGSTTLVNMPFVNPFQASAAKPLVLQVRDGKIATVARIAQTTSMAQAVQGLSLKSSSESLDRDVIPFDMVLNHAGRTPAQGLPLVQAGTTDFPRMRFFLTDEKGNAISIEDSKAKVGFLVDVPCSAQGTVRMIWKRQNDEREYLTQFALNPRADSCQDKQTIGHSFLLPNGDWMLKASMIAEQNAFQPDVQTSWLKTPSKVLRQYFSLEESSFRWTLETSKEREIRRPLMVQLDSLSRRHNELRTRQDVFRVSSSPSEQQVLFLGHFEIRNAEAKNDRAGVWETFLKKDFTLETAQSLLGSKNIYNAYTLERLIRSRSLKVNTVMRTASDQDDLPTVKPVAAEFRGEAAKAYAACLHAREEADPLVNMGGELRFTVLKGGDSVTLKRLKIGEDGLSDKWVESCLEKKLMSFRFSKKAPANFQGELKFSSE